MQIYAIQSNELIPINANGREYKILIDKKVVPQSSIAFANYHFDKSVAGSLHYHETETEVYYCLKGKGWIIIEGEKYILEPGSVIYIPPGAKHQTFSDDHSELEFLAIFTPPIDF